MPGHTVFIHPELQLSWEAGEQVRVEVQVPIPRFFRRRAPRHVILYGKPGCHLCEDARLLLAELERRYPMTLTEVDITADPQLFRRYDIRIPVVVIDGGAEIEAPVTRAALERALRRR